jgi:multidrug resistance efflux pump
MADKLKAELQRKTNEVNRLKNLNKKIANSKTKQRNSQSRTEDEALGDDMFLNFFSFLRFG